MKIYNNIEQRTEEWEEIRKGKLTASNAQAIASNGKGLESYIYQVLAQKYSLNSERYTDINIERGIELEEQSRQVYELTTGEIVRQVGFIEMDEHCGCSPDGLVGEDGGIEIKCHFNEKHLKLIIDNKIESKYIWQMQMFMLIANLKWCDYVAYNPNFEKALVVVRVLPDIKKQEKLKIGIESGKKLMKEYEEKFLNNK
jgi:exodeoxyribonuclease (lambda-induced)